MDPGLVAVIIIAVVAVAAIAFGVVLLFRTLRGDSVRKSIVSLIGRKEAIRSAYDALYGAVERLANSDDAELARFNEDPEDEERKTFREVEAQMLIAEDELKNTDVPRSLEGITVMMEDTVRLVHEAAGSVDGAGETEPLAAAGEIDFSYIGSAVEHMEKELQETAERNHVEDRSVYGGGLYI